MLQIEEVDARTDNGEFLYSLSSQSDRKVIWVAPTVNGVKINMELDTGSGLTVMSKDDFKRYFPNDKLKETDMTLRTYSGEVIRPCGL